MDIMDIININLTVFYALPDNLICLGEPVFLSKIYIYNISSYIHLPYLWGVNYLINQALKGYFNGLWGQCPHEKLIHLHNEKLQIKLGTKICKDVLHQIFIITT